MKGVDGEMTLCAPLRAISVRRTASLRTAYGEAIQLRTGKRAEQSK
jgi:hypothetical protein